jgi:hypothetical protein
VSKKKTGLSAAPQIGVALPRADARDKVSGQAVYSADAFPENFLWAGVKRTKPLTAA